MVNPIASFVVAVGLDGRIASQGTLEQALASDSKLREEVAVEKKAIAEGEEVVDVPIHEPKKEGKPKPAAGKLTVAEEVALGRVSWPACKSIIRPVLVVLTHPTPSKNVFVVPWWRAILDQLHFWLLPSRSLERCSDILARVSPQTTKQDRSS